MFDEYYVTMNKFSTANGLIKIYGRTFEIINHVSLTLKFKLTILTWKNLCFTKKIH